MLGQFTPAFLVLLVVFIVSVIPLVIYKYRPKKLAGFKKRVPKKLKDVLIENEKVMLRDYKGAYASSIIILLFFWYFAIDWFYRLHSGIITPTIELIAIGAVMALNLGSITIYTILFFSKYLNVKILHLSKRNRKKYLPFVVKLLIGWRNRISALCSLAIFLFSIWFIFTLPETSIPISSDISVPITYVLLYLLASCFIVSEMLTLRIPNASVLVWTLHYLKDIKNDPDNYEHAFMLSKAVEYSRGFISQDLHIAQEVDLSNYFELLYIARIWGNDSERKAAVDEIQNLISAVKKDDTRKFVESLCGIDENANFASLVKLKSSAKITIMKSSSSVDSVVNPLKIVGGILTIVSIILGILRYIQ